MLLPRLIPALLVASGLYLSPGPSAVAAPLAALLSAQLASSDWHEVHSSRWLSPRQIRRILREEGFSHIEILGRNGRVYRARAEDYRGRTVIVKVSARSGEIISVKRLGRPHHPPPYHPEPPPPPPPHHPDPDFPGPDEPQCWLPEGCSY